MNCSLEDEFISSKRKITNLINNKKFENLLRENAFDNLFEPNAISSCQFQEANEFTLRNRNGDDFLNIFSMNIRSLPKHGGELVCFFNLMTTKFDVVVLTEVRAKNITLVENLLPGYKFYYIIPDKNKCGGVGIYMRDTIDNITPIEDVSMSLACGCTRCEVESLFLHFVFRGVKYTVCGIYRHPNGNINHFTEKLERILAKLSNDNRVLITGDLNIDLIKFADDESTLSYLTTLLSWKYLPYTTLPARITSHSATCIDHVFLKISEREQFPNIENGIFYCDISDHLPCFISIHHGNRFNASNRPMTRIFSEKNCANFKSKMESVNWEQIYQNEDDDFYTNFVTVVLQIYNSCFPLVRVSRKRWNDKPWLTKGLKTSIKTKHRLYALSLNKPKPENTTKYKTYRNLLQKCLKTAEVRYYNEMFDNHRNSTINLWKQMGRIINPKTTKTFVSINKLIIDGKVITDHKMLSDGMNNYFCNVGSKLHADIPDRPGDYKKYLPPRLMHSFYLMPVVRQDILDEIKCLNSRKAPGHDSIGGKVIKLCREIFSDNLCRIFNRAIEKRIYPNDLKIAKVIALYKKGAKFDPGNYRPISLLSFFDKIFEKILCRQLTKFLEKYQVFYAYQFGFRKRHSTVQALIEFTDNIKRLLDE